MKLRVALRTVWISALLLTSTAMAQTAVANDELPPGFHQGRLQRDDGSELVFYSNVANLDGSLPLVVWAQGSGSQSLFPIKDGELHRGAYQLISQALGDGLHLVAVEKRGVEFGQTGRGAALDATLEYHSYATLEDRVSDLLLVLSALEQRNALPKSILAVGHSEGADVAARLAADSDRVTHLAFLAGGGPSQLFDFMTLIRKSSATERDKEAQIDQLWQDWAAIKADPSSIEKMYQGHAYRRWSSYLNWPPLKSLLKTEAKIFMAHGSQDDAVPIESADLCAVELELAGKTFEYLRLPDADHSLRTPSQIASNSPPLLSLGQILRRFFLGER